MKTLYKKDSKGKLRILNIYTDGADLVQSSGLADGKLVEARKTCKGKNIGKSNETSPEDQAENEMKSKITEKLKTDYFETEEEAMNTVVLLPMLAKEYEKTKSKIDWTKEVYVQPKMDGMRCLAIVKDGTVKFISRENTDILDKHNNSIIHLVPEFEKLPNGVYDGELYAHGYTFQENMELIKKYRSGESENIKFHAYDYVIDKPYWIRRSYLVEAAKLTPYIELVRTEKITTEKAMKTYHSIFVGEGYEGTIIRHGDQGYDIDKRSNYLLKFKEFIDVAETIIDVIPMEARPTQGVIVCSSVNGNFKASLKMSHSERERILKDKKDYIGQTAEIRFFEYTDDGLPRFPVCVGFRLDK